VKDQRWFPRLMTRAELEAELSQQGEDESMSFEIATGILPSDEAQLEE
jgi:hypothetical protein